MSKVVVLNLGKGNLQTGFPFVTAQLNISGKVMQFTGSLTAFPELLELYRRWQLLYELLYKARSINIRSFSSLAINQDKDEDEDDDIIIDEADITHVSDSDFDDICKQLKLSLDNWLDSPGFRLIERQLRKELHPQDEIQFIIQTEDSQLRKIPWYIWQFCHDYRRAEISLSSLNFEPGKIKHTSGKKVRILAIIGDSTEIDIETDRKFIAGLTDAETVFLVEPQRQELDEFIWDKKGWDILFFAGHSNTEDDGNSGNIYINKTDSLTINQLKNALSRAIETGLQLAIFNSCEGLGLAAQLTELHIPQIIVMREPVPDSVAQQFLKYFLTAFAKDESFYLSVREARERLQGIEAQFPGASWLPVIFQNPAEIPPTWQQLRDKLDFIPASQAASIRPKFSTVILSSVIITVLLMGLRWLGVMQPWELKAFDFLMQKMPIQKADKRILVIGADEEDISSSRYGYPLPDKTLNQLLEKIQTYQPAAIGVDIFRDQQVPKNNNNQQTLLNQWQKDKNIIAICAGNNLKNSTAPPQNISPQQVGFVDLYDDKSQTQEQDDTIRRYLLSRTPNPISQISRCSTAYSFAWQLIYRYFKSKGIPVRTVDKNWQFGDVIVKRLQPRSGGYQNLDASGNQLLINYRNTPKIAQKVTIRDVLENSNYFNPDWVKDRIVLVGVTATSIRDIHDTPYGEIRGLFIHAHGISQILSAVEDNRALIWWLPQWGDTILVLFFSCVGGIIIWYWRNPKYQIIAISSAAIIIYIVCWFAFTKGGWFPLIPSILALLSTSGIVAVLILKRQNVMGN
ncbi:putative transmembrane sensor domain protein [Rivularia sp. PCC 7116]|uniref:CHASE2 domain-containing protein n=1 Tax=Rivularia sp. PCC 7116 TaxID=373994 RepID=UPI00029EE4D9|nr:CHASE2 domain-containing protein [Rivularia sp. PCC 7116]AFY54224.1 putative transmembrane sensor domain protein [Rivularia sp. PCC 7116]